MHYDSPSNTSHAETAARQATASGVVAVIVVGRHMPSLPWQALKEPPLLGPHEENISVHVLPLSVCGVLMEQTLTPSHGLMLCRSRTHPIV